MYVFLSFSDVSDAKYQAALEKSGIFRIDDKVKMNSNWSNHFFFVLKVRQLLQTQRMPFHLSRISKSNKKIWNKSLWSALEHVETCSECDIFLRIRLLQWKYEKYEHVVAKCHFQLFSSLKIMSRTTSVEENKRIIMDLDVISRSADSPFIVRCFGYFVRTVRSMMEWKREKNSQLRNVFSRYSKKFGLVWNWWRLVLRKSPKQRKNPSPKKFSAN